MRCRGFTLIELLVVIAIIAVLMAVLLPALASARNTARLAVSLSNMKQIATAHELYRVDRRDALPIPVLFEGDSSGNAVSAVQSLGGKYSRTAWSGTSFDFWPGERLLNPYTNPNDRLAKPTDLAPSWTILQTRPDPEPGVRESVQMSNWRSPGDKRARVFWTLPPDPVISEYENIGTSYLGNPFWIESYAFATTGSVMNVAAWRRAVRWGNSTYNRLNTSRFVVSFDSTAYAARIAFPISGAWPVIPGQFGGANKSVMGFADGHSAYIELVRRPPGVFPFCQNGMGTLTRADFDYSFQMDLPAPR